MSNHAAKYTAVVFWTCKPVTNYVRVIKCTFYVVANLNYVWNDFLFWNDRIVKSPYTFRKLNLFRAIVVMYPNRKLIVHMSGEPL